MIQGRNVRKPVAFVVSFLLLCGAGKVLSSVPLVAWFERVRDEKEIRVSGLKSLGEHQVRSLLPEETTFWYYRHVASLGSYVQSHSSVRSARVSVCPSVVWGCFKVEVVEHEAAAVFLSGEGGSGQMPNQGNVAWFISEDGTQLGASVSAATGARQAREQDLLLIHGRWHAASPEILRGQLRYVLSVSNVIGERLGWRPQRVVLERGGDSVWTVSRPGRGSMGVFGPEHTLQQLRLVAPEPSVTRTVKEHAGCLTAQLTRVPDILTLAAAQGVPHHEVELGHAKLIVLRGEQNDGRTKE